MSQTNYERPPKKTDYKPGDRVSLARWDKHARPVNRYGDSHVVSVSHGVQCESGTMVAIQSDSRPDRKQELDAHWLSPL